MRSAATFFARAENRQTHQRRSCRLPRARAWPFRAVIPASPPRADRRAGARVRRERCCSGSMAAVTRRPRMPFVKADIAQIAAEVTGRILEVRHP